MKSFILIAIIAAVASSIYAEEAVEVKKQDKRGLLGLGYGGYYSGLGAASGLGGYGGYYNNHYSSPLLSLNHGALPTYAHAHAPAVSYGSHLGGYHQAPIYSSPLRLGYSNLGYSHGAGLGHGLNYLHGGNIW